MLVDVANVPRPPFLFSVGVEPDCESRLAILIKSQESCWATRFYFLFSRSLDNWRNETNTKPLYKICFLTWRTFHAHEKKDMGPSDLLRAHVVPSTARTAPYLAARVSVFEYGGTYKRGVGEWVGGWV